ncbi:hypothetical protein GCM10011365_20120 [Marinicella pacifica]|uniref:Uncharacterized protein n=1 Tax=Marinicella pacifica TaxID=1171543 RepID=A0A917CVC6_9GAMM|nr:hypothetical protein GCM10011365_20120 [Marinicella pacifica]
MQDDSVRPQFAPLYSRRERWRLLLWALVVTGLLALLMITRLLPWLNSFLPTAHCQTIFGINGLSAVMLLMFVAAPLLLVIFLLVFEGPKSWRVWRLKQTPLPNEKVMKPTRYRYGNRALLRPIGFLIVIIVLLGLTVWAFILVENISDQITTEMKTCPQSQISPE